MEQSNRRQRTAIALSIALVFAIGVLVALVLSGPGSRPSLRAGGGGYSTYPPPPPSPGTVTVQTPPKTEAGASSSGAVVGAVTPPGRPPATVGAVTPPAKPPAAVDAPTPVKPPAAGVVAPQLTGPAVHSPPVAAKPQGAPPPVTQPQQPPIAARSPTVPGDISEFVRRFGKAVVRIEQQQPDGNLRSVGTGFIVSANGYIVTNYHVIDSPDGIGKLVVKLLSGQQAPVRSVVAVDADRDLAVLSIQAKDLPTVPLGNSDIVREGERIFVIGHPLGLTNTVTDGLVSGVRDLKDGTQLIQISAQISPGNSGGPLFNMAGEVVGVVVAKIKGAEGLSFCIPIRDVIPIVQGLPGIKLDSRKVG